MYLYTSTARRCLPLFVSVARVSLRPLLDIVISAEPGGDVGPVLDTRDAGGEQGGGHETMVVYQHMLSQFLTDRDKSGQYRMKSEHYMQVVLRMTKYLFEPKKP